MRSVNEVRISGTIVRDPDFHTFDSGSRVVNFGLSVDRNAKVRDFPDVKGWDEIADALKEHGTTGRIVFVEGRLQTDLYEDKNAPANGDGKAKKRKSSYVLAKHVRIVDEQTGSTLCDVEATKQQPEDEPAAAV